MTNILRNNYWISRAMLLSGGHFFSDMYPGFLSAVLPLLMMKYGFSLTFAGLLAATAAFSGSFIQTVFGYLSDRSTRRFFIVIGPVISALFYSSIGYMPDKWILLLCVFIGGIGQAQFHPLAAKMTNQLSEEHKGKAMSIFVSGGTVGFAVGPIVVTTLIAYRDIYILPVAVIPAILIALLLYRFAPKHTVLHSSERKRILSRSNLKQLASVTTYVTIGALRSFVIMSFNTFIPILFSFRGYSLKTGGLALFILHFSGGIGVLVGGFLSDRIDPKKIISGSFLFAAPALLLFLNSSGFISYCALGLAGGLLLSSIPTVITQAQAALPGHMSTVSSMVMGVSWGVGGILVSFVGRAADIFGLVPTLNVLAFFPFIGFFLSLILHYQTVKETRLPEYI